MLTKEVEQYIKQYISEAFLRHGYNLSFEDLYRKTVASYKGMINEINEKGALAIEFSVEDSRTDCGWDWNCQIGLGILFADPLGPLAASQIYEYNNEDWPIHFINCKIVDNRILYLSYDASMFFKIYPQDKYNIKMHVNKTIDNYFRHLTEDESLTKLIRILIAESKILPFLK